MPKSPPSDAELQRVAEKLPTAPRLFLEFGQIVGNPNSESDDAVALLRQDQPLVARIIRMANSAAYAPPEPVGSLERALAFVGFAEVHRLVGAVAAAQLADQQVRLYPIDGKKLRAHTVFVAVLMEELAKWTGERPRSCYTVGLLRTIGMSVLEHLAAPDCNIPPFLESGETVLDVWEQEHWGITNVEVAERILLSWRLPNETVKAIRHHYRPSGLHNPIIHMLALSVSAAADRYYGILGEESYWRLTPENFAKAGIDVRSFHAVCERAQRKYEHLSLALA